MIGGNLFCEAVLNNLRELWGDSHRGVGYLLPDPGLIGAALDAFMQSKYDQAVAAGQVRLDPQSDQASIINVYA